MPLTVLSMVESLKPAAFTLSPLSPNTLRILVLVEVCNKSSKLSFRVLSPGPVMSITSMSWMRLSLILVRSRVKSEPSNTRVSIPPPPSTRARLPQQEIVML
jgi:hypothetical protein